MSLQKSVHFLGELWADSFGRGNFLHARFSQSIDRSEFSEQQIFPVLAHPGTIVENTFVDPFAQEQLMISIRETVRLVANALEQVERAGIGRQTHRQRAPGSINFFVFFRQTNDRQFVQTKPLQFATRGRKLPFASVDNDQVRQENIRRFLFEPA